jgi:hypothetical protein
MFQWIIVLFSADKHKANEHQQNDTIETHSSTAGTLSARQRDQALAVAATEIFVSGSTSGVGSFMR